MEVIVDSIPLALVDDAGYWFSIWGGYSEFTEVNQCLLVATKIIRHRVLSDGTRIANLNQQVSAN